MALCKATLIGNVGRDPEQKWTQGGTQMVNFSVACNRMGPLSPSGERQEVTEWFNVICFGKLAEVAERLVTKGSRVYVEGRLQTRSYEGRDGQPRHVIEVVATELQMLSARQRTEGGEYPMPAASGMPAPMPVGSADNENLDDVPF